MSKDLSRYDKDDPTFVADLKKSDRHVDKVIDWITSRGYKATKKPLRIRANVNEMADYADDGDIDMVRRNGETVRVEAKQRMVDFTCQKDFPYKTVIVDVAHAFDKANPKPFMYVLTNKAATHCMVVNTDTQRFWIRTDKWDAAKKRMRSFLECPIEHAQFFDMREQALST